MSNHLYVVILTLNAVEHIKRLLTALTTVSIPMRVIVIDNGSTDGTRDYLSSIHSDGLIYVPNETNIGVAAGWNLGIRIATANGAQAVLVVGHDTWPMPGTVERLIALLQEGVPFVTGTSVPYDTPETAVALPPQGSALLAAPDFSFFLMGLGVVEVLGRFDATTGNISPWDMGLFDRQFAPAYFEDGDYHIRLQRAGIFAARDPGALFRHDCSLTLRSTPAVAQQNQTTFNENAQKFAKKWGALPHQLDVPAQARPLNVTDEQWTRMTGGRPVIELNRAELAEQARAVYARYGIAA